jgi:hypothetical protein
MHPELLKVLYVRDIESSSAGEAIIYDMVAEVKYGKTRDQMNFTAALFGSSAVIAYSWVRVDAESGELLDSESFFEVYSVDAVRSIYFVFGTLVAARFEDVEI